MRHIAILGSTGSIGQSALAVVDAHADRLKVVGLAAGENADVLAAQIARYQPDTVSMASGEALDRLQRNGSVGVTIGGSGRDGLVAVATAPDVDIVLCAVASTAAESSPDHHRAAPAGSLPLAPRRAPTRSALHPP